MPDNLTRLKEAYQAWNDTKGDPEVFRGLLAERFNLRTVDETPPGLGYARDRFSRDEALDYLGGVLAEWEMIHYTPQTFVREDELIAMFGSCAYRHRKTGKSAEARTSALWRFEGDEAVAMIEVFDSALAVAAATPD